VSAGQPVRRNPYLGAECPPWCQVDHDDGKSMSACVGGGGSGGGSLWARAILGRCGPLVAVDGVDDQDFTRSAYTAVSPREAEQLAVFVELLALATPGEHLKLAAAIREAAAQAAQEGES
jgi:hypothetical protein